MLFARHLPVAQIELELGAVEFCTFENMYAVPQAVLSRRRRDEGVMA